MSASPGSAIPRSLSQKLALRVQAALMHLDARLLTVLVSALGLCAWLGPWQIMIAIFPASTVSAVMACVLMPRGRRVVFLYFGFIAFWAVSYVLLQLWERPGMTLPALTGGLIFGGRLFALLGLALVIPLTTTPLTLGRVLTWYVERLACVFRPFVRIPLLGQLHALSGKAWQCGLALVIMVAFLPRAFSTLGSLKQSLALRAPRMPLHRRLVCMGLAALRVLGTQAWDMAVSITARNLYRPGPWKWQPTARNNA